MATPRKSRSNVSPTKKLELAKTKITTAEESFEYLKACFYGNNGRGKTRLGASGPKPFLIDCNEKGTLSIRHFEDVQVFSASVFTDADLAFWYMKSGKHDRKTVVIDNITSLAQLCMNFVLGDEVSRDATKDPAMAGKREWGKVSQLMKTTVNNFRNLDMHVVFLAQEKRGFVEDEDEEAPEIFPAVSPSVRETLTAAVDIIGRLYVKEVVRKDPKTKKNKAAMEYRMLIGPSERYNTKDRSEAGLPSVIRLGPGHDNLTRLIERIKEGARDGG